MGRPLPGIHTELINGQLHIDPSTSPTFFLRYLGGDPHGGSGPQGTSSTPTRRGICGSADEATT